MKLKRFKDHSKKIWHFFWEDDSLWSWLANIVVAFLLIRFIVYPLLGLILGTSFPIVAVVSESMEHGLHDDVLCGRQFNEFRESFDNYWSVCGGWYEEKGITKEQFKKFSFKNGFNKGDVIILWRANKNNLEVGNILVFQGNKPQPIIHRIVDKQEEEGKIYYQTKGDHNSDSISGTYGEIKIDEERLLGKGVIRIPYLGWLKILFVDAVKPLGINIQR
ncbi:MAG: signal peptidase I [Nanoarchaeota archaeon]|nr:signal peptidase I [Nanoarchaeota archaeon]MBU1632024.1 signal peptidase I [Nanoarchaeota archaeon]MBU1875968.1 signal peptidase I [Nanoarchaeota archaeon]